MALYIDLAGARNRTGLATGVVTKVETFWVYGFCPYLQGRY